MNFWQWYKQAMKKDLGMIKEKNVKPKELEKKGKTYVIVGVILFIFRFIPINGDYSIAELYRLCLNPLVNLFSNCSDYKTYNILLIVFSVAFVLDGLWLLYKRTLKKT